jgi:hypothetical protein
MSDEDDARQQAQKDLLWGLYTDVRNHARHAETLRANAVSVVLLITTALIALVTSDGHVVTDELPICFLITLVGLVGLAFAGSYTELYERNWWRAKRIRTALDARFFSAGDPTLQELLATSDPIHQARWSYRWTRRLTGSARQFWLVVPLLVATAGVVLTIMAA